MSEIIKFKNINQVIDFINSTVPCAAIELYDEIHKGCNFRDDMILNIKRSEIVCIEKSELQQKVEEVELLFHAKMNKYLIFKTWEDCAKLEYDLIQLLKQKHPEDFR